MLSPKELLDHMIEALNTDSEDRYVQLASPELELRAPERSTFVALRGSASGIEPGKRRVRTARCAATTP